MESIRYKYNIGILIILVATYISIPLLFIQRYLYNIEFKQLLLNFYENGGVLAGIIGIISYLGILSYLGPIIYWRIKNELALEIFPGEKIIYYRHNGNIVIPFSIIKNIKFINTSGRYGKTSIFIQIDKKDYSKKITKLGGVSLTSGDSSIEIILRGIDANSNLVYKEILSDYKKFLEKK